MLEPDPIFVEHILRDASCGGEEGLQDRLNDVGRLAADWNVVLECALPGASCSLVFRGWRVDGTQVVLKLPVVGEEKTSGAAAARAFARHGGIQILNSDIATGALLMPLATPGANLANHDLSDDEALDRCVDTIRRLREADADLERFRCMIDFDWFGNLTEPMEEPIGPEWAPQVRELLVELRSTTTEETLLHGDLHHYNLIDHEGEWVAIDPKGLVGDPAREVVPFMRNPLPWIGEVPNLGSLLERRLERFADALGDPLERLWGWSMVETTSDAMEPESPRNEPWTKVNEALFELGVRRGWM